MSDHKTILVLFNFAREYTSLLWWSYRKGNFQNVVEVGASEGWIASSDKLVNNFQFSSCSLPLAFTVSDSSSFWDFQGSARLQVLFLFCKIISDFSPHFLHYLSLLCLLSVLIYSVLMIELFLSFFNDGLCGFVSQSPGLGCFLWYKGPKMSLHLILKLKSITFQPIWLSLLSPQLCWNCFCQGHQRSPHCQSMVTSLASYYSASYSNRHS